MAHSIDIKQNQILKQWTSWKVGGPAEFYCAPKSIEELKHTLKFSYEKQLPVTVLGGGTNVLISDEGILGLVIHTHLLNEVKIIKEDQKEVIIEAMTGAQKSEVLKSFMKLRLAPAIFLAGLPGDMGGGVVMNAGVGHKTQPREFCEIVHGVDVLEVTPAGEIKEKTFLQKDIQWQYRKSYNWQPGVIGKVRVSWPNQPDPAVLQDVREGNKRRKLTQPLNQPSCGSVFKNPPNDHAGRLIEAAGLKGFQIGGAQVSEKHANFIVNLGPATANDIDQLIQHVEKTVLDKFNISLTNEVVFLGYSREKKN